MPRSIREAIYPLFTKMFEHHSNPWSAWTRLLSTVPRPRPVLDPELGTHFPRRCVVGCSTQPCSRNHDDSAWPTRAMLGEEMRVAKRPLGKAMTVNAAAPAFGLGGVVASLKRKRLPNVLFTVSEVARLLLYWRLMSDYYVEHRDDLEGKLYTTGRVSVIEGQKPRSLRSWAKRRTATGEEDTATTSEERRLVRYRKSCPTPRREHG